MIRRALPVAAAAMALALVPSAASAAPPLQGVDVVTSTGYSATTEVQLPDGRLAVVSFTEYPSVDGKGRAAGGMVWIRPDADCWASGDCDSGTGMGHVELVAGQLGFDRALRGVALAPVTVRLHRFDYNAPTSTDEPITVSVTFTGTGAVDRNVEHRTQCASIGTQCQTQVLEGQRLARATVTVDGARATATGRLSYGKSVSVGTPGKIGSPSAPDDGGGSTPPPDDGSGSTPPPDDGSGSIPPPDDGGGDIAPPDDSGSVPPLDEGSGV